MGSCFCTGACRETGQCPNNNTYVPWNPQPPPIRPIYPPLKPAPAPVTTTPIVINNGVTEEKIREIIREEIHKALEEFDY